MTQSILYRLRIEKGYTQKQLSEKIGVNPNTFGRWERELALPSKQNFERLSKVLDVPISVLHGLNNKCMIKRCQKIGNKYGFCVDHYGDAREMILEKRISKRLNGHITAGNKLKELRENIEMTQEKMASFFGVTVETWDAWEKNRVRPSLHMLIDIADFFGVGTRDLEKRE